LATHSSAESSVSGRFDVDMTISAFDRIAAPDKPKKAAEAPPSEAKP